MRNRASSHDVYARFILIQGSQIFGRTWKHSNKPIRYAKITDVKEQNNNVNLVKYRLIFTLEKTEKNLKMIIKKNCWRKKRDLSNLRRFAWPPFNYLDC